MTRKKIAVVAATSMELDSLRNHCEAASFSNLEIMWIVTGVGMVNTAMQLTQQFATDCPSIAINMGIAGSFDASIAIGDTVQVHTDRIAYFGAEDSDTFLSAEQIGLCAIEDAVFKATYTKPIFPKAIAITVNLAHGNSLSIQKAVELWNPQLESMEGAAFFKVCRHFEVPSIQIRTISNRVEPRNKDLWNIPLALQNLTNSMLLVLQNMNDGN